MAYLSNLEKKKNDEIAQFNTSGVVGSSALPTSSNISATRDTPTSGWTNLQDYLDVNRGVGVDSAKYVTKGINEEVDQTSNAIDDFGNNTINDYNTKSQEYDKTSGGIVSGLNDASSVLDPAKNFLSTTVNPYSKDDITAQKDATVSKVKGIGDAQNQKSTFGKLGGSGYKSNWGDLNVLLIRSDENAQNVIKDTVGKGDSLNKKLDTTIGDVEASYKSAQDALQNEKNEVISGAKDAKTKAESGISNRALNYGLENKGNVGFKGASIGDVISDDENIDIQALSEIGGLDYSPYSKTYNVGTLPPRVDSEKSGKLPYNDKTKPTIPDKVFSGLEKPLDATQTNLGNLSTSVSSGFQGLGDYLNEKGTPIINKITPTTISTKYVPKVRIR